MFLNQERPEMDDFEEKINSIKLMINRKIYIKKIRSFMLIFVCNNYLVDQYKNA